MALQFFGHSKSSATCRFLVTGCHTGCHRESKALLAPDSSIAVFFPANFSLVNLHFLEALERERKVPMENCSLTLGTTSLEELTIPASLKTAHCPRLPLLGCSFLPGLEELRRIAFTSLYETASFKTTGAGLEWQCPR